MASKVDMSPLRNVILSAVPASLFPALASQGMESKDPYWIGAARVNQKELT